MATIMRVGGGAGGGEKPLLPKDYIQLRYIENTGTEYIDTGFKPNGYSRVVADFDLISGGTYPVPFGAWMNGTNTFIVLSLSSNSVRAYYNNTEKDASVGIFGRHIIDLNQGSLSIDETPVLSIPTASFYCDNSLFLFAYNGGHTDSTFKTIAKYYACQIYDNGTLVRDLIPCKNPYGIVGMYDIVGKKFYGNAGSGEFLAGPTNEGATIVAALNTGDIIRITENGIPTEYYIAKHGYEPELNGANRTLLVRKDCHGYRRWHSSNVNAYETSDIDAWLNGDFYNSLSASVQEVIGATKFKYTPGNGNNTVSTLERAVFLLSLTEYGLANTYANAEGSKLPSADAIRLAKVDGTATTHWTRTPATNGKTNIYWVYMDGLSNNNGYATDEFGVRPAFTIPHDAKLAGQDNEGKWSLEVETASEVYGIARDITASSPEWTRTDAAMTFTAKASIGTVAGASDFDNIYPWSEMKRVTLDTGDVMVRIPKFYYGRTRNGNIERIQISGRADVGLTLHPAFNHGGVEADCIYVGAYCAGGDGANSKSGLTPSVWGTRAACRTAVRNKGVGWHLLDISTLSAIQMLYLVEFANNNSQAMVGRGYCDGNSAAINTGSCDTVPNLTGRPAGTDGKTDIVYRGIEGIWGNVWEFVDGFNYFSGNLYACNDPSKYAEDTSTGYDAQMSYTVPVTLSGTYLSKMGLDTNGNPHIMLPEAASGGSESTYFCDAGWSSSSGWRVYGYGGAYALASGVGLFALTAQLASSATDATFGSRLIYIP